MSGRYAEAAAADWHRGQVTPAVDALPRRGPVPPAPPPAPPRDLRAFLPGFAFVLGLAVGWSMRRGSRA